MVYYTFRRGNDFHCRALYRSGNDRITTDRYGDCDQCSRSNQVGHGDDYFEPSGRLCHSHDEHLNRGSDTAIPGQHHRHGEYSGDVVDQPGKRRNHQRSRSIHSPGNACVATDSDSDSDGDKSGGYQQDGDRHDHTEPARGYLGDAGDEHLSRKPDTTIHGQCHWNCEYGSDMVDQPGKRRNHQHSRSIYSASNDRLATDGGLKIASSGAFERITAFEYPYRIGPGVATCG